MIQTTINKLPNSELEIKGVLEAGVFADYEAKALARIGERMEIAGFRKGRVPTELIKQNTQEMMLLEEMAQDAIYDVYPQILEENKIDAIGRPQITITKIAKGNDLEFTIVTVVLPEMDLPDYKSYAKKENSNEANKKEIVVSEEDLDKVIMDLRKMRAGQNEDHDRSDPNHVHEEESNPRLVEEGAGGGDSDENLPEVNDEFAKSFGPFENVDAFKSKIRENIKLERETAEKDKVRLAIIESIIKDTKGDIPEVLIEAETNKLLYRLEADITNMGFKMDEYLKQIGKTEDDMKKEWRPEAEKRAKLELIVHNISEKENLKPSKEEVEKEVTQITEMYKDADPVRAQAYVEQMLTNEKVFQFLENQ